MNFKLLVPLALIFFCFQPLFSQIEFLPSLIVNHQNDTIYGVGNISNNQKYCLFKKFDATEFTKYYANEINTFRIIDGKYFASREIKESNGEKKWYFLEYLVDGKIDLYAISNSGRFFIKKENEEFLELNDNITSVQEIDGTKYLVPDKKYLGYMRVYMSETPELYTKIDKMKRLNQRDLINLSIDYHNATCNEYECVNYTKHIPKVRYKLELSTGVTNHNSNYKPFLGLLVHIWRPQSNEKLYLKTGIIYSTKPYLYQKSIDIYAPSKNEFREIGYTNEYSIKIPFSLQYVFGKKDFKPTIAIGSTTGIFLLSSFQGGFIYSLSDNFEFSLSGSIDGLIAMSLNKHEVLYNNKLGHTLSFGLIYNL